MDKACGIDLNVRSVSQSKTFFQAYLQTIQRVGVVLFIFALAGTFFDQWVTNQMALMLANPQGTSHWVWFYGAISLVWGVVYPLANLLLILSVLQPQPLLKFWFQTFPHAMIELMRSWGKSMLWAFLLIIPGVVAFIRYLFVPFIVCLDPLYPQGEREALQRSWALSKGRMWRLFGFFMLTSLVVPAFLSVFDDLKILTEHPVTSVLICLLEMFLNIAFSLWLWKIYQRSVQNESALPMEGH